MLHPTASDTFRDSPYYRRDAFRNGLARLGYKVGVPPRPKPDPGDVLLIWNRAASNDIHARRYENAGAKVIVVENGYIGTDPNGRLLYAMALWHHLGAGTWREGPEDRWGRLGIELSPWRKRGSHIVVLPQRGFGEPGIGMPRTWTDDVVRRLHKVTDRPVKVRQHPGASKTDPKPDLAGAWAAVTWASGAGIKALVHGIPVFHEMSSWIGAPAALHGIKSIESPFLGDRLPMFRRLAYSQWTVDEVWNGEPFAWLLR